jgi:structure-specific recognition protein 1
VRSLTCKISFCAIQLIRRLTPRREAFNDIYLNLSRKPGATRFSDSGFGWKPANGETYTCDQSQIIQAQWSRAARGYEVKILSRNDGIIQLDGFKQEDFDRVAKVFKTWYGISLDNREHALRGWNWGKADFGKAELTFNVANRPAFEVPYTEVSNTNLAGKNEVAVDFSLPADSESGANGQLGGARFRGKKSAGARDQLVEMRFYIPGLASKKEKTEDGENASGAEDGEETNAANLFYETLMEKAEIGEVAGDTFATFLDILHLTPRYGICVCIHILSANLEAGVGSILTCTRARSGYAAKHTTTRSSLTRSRSLWFCQSLTTCIP